MIRVNSYSFLLGAIERREMKGAVQERDVVDRNEIKRQSTQGSFTRRTKDERKTNKVDERTKLTGSNRSSLLALSGRRAAIMSAFMTAVVAALMLVSCWLL